jgi:hypothetical protein
MNVADALTGEHGVFHLLVEQLDDTIDRCQTTGELHRAAAPLALSLVGHARIEETTLFAPLERRIGTAGTMDQQIRAASRCPNDRAGRRPHSKGLARLNCAPMRA